MFRACNIITSVPTFQTNTTVGGSSINMSDMFYGCNSLISLPTLNTLNVTDMKELCYGCHNLANVPVLDTSRITASGNMYNMFTNCESLSNDSLNNIMEMCINSGITSGTRTLKNIGLTSAQATTCQSLSNYTAFTNAGWTKGY